MTAAVVETRGLHKYFAVTRPLRERLFSPFDPRRRICALENVNLRLPPGEILGIVGPNGAGKTTLLRILADVLEPDAGTAEICGQPLRRGQDHLRRQVGCVFSDERSFFWRLSGRQNLEFFAGLYGVGRREARTRMRRLLDLFGMWEKSGQLFRDYSSGTRKKFGVLRALLHQPRVVLLDEVTNSLDPPSTQMVKTLVRDYVNAEEGRVALWSTHRLEEIGEVCDRIIALEHGRIDFYGSAEAFAAAFKPGNERGTPLGARLSDVARQDGGPRGAALRVSPRPARDAVAREEEPYSPGV